MGKEKAIKIIPSELGARDSAKDIACKKELVEKEQLFIKTINAFPEIVLIVNKNRQIIYCNKKLLDFLRVSLKDILGKRLGEVFGCINSDREPSGCGTSEFCQECGALKSTLLANEGDENSQECRMSRRLPDKEGQFAADLRVWSVPFNVQREYFTVITLQDITDEKRREVLERAFFHDVLNNTAILSYYVENLAENIIPRDDGAIRKLHSIVNMVIGEINVQRDLLDAENGKLSVSLQEFSVYEFLKELLDSYSRSVLVRDKTLVLDCHQRGVMISTDKVLLNRVINNLVKNALEATAEGKAVTVGYINKDSKHIFSIHNPEVMPEDVRLQIFQRSFTTKGKGRGIGTYGAKFIAEKYLNCRVYFESNKEVGTIFFVELK
jgi:signal transduction histidine kinase